MTIIKKTEGQQMSEGSVRKISQEEFKEIAEKRVEEESRRKVVCDRCGEVLFDGTVEELAAKADGGQATFECQNEDFEDPRPARRATIQNDEGEQEVVEIERKIGCTSVNTVSV